MTATTATARGSPPAWRAALQWFAEPVRPTNGKYTMTRYLVKFFNHLLSSDGHPFKVLQRAILVQSDNAEEAARIGERRFERLEHIPDWRLHADAVETTPDEAPPSPAATRSTPSPSAA